MLFNIPAVPLCMVPEKDILSPSLPTAAAYSFLPLKDQSGENGCVSSPQGAVFTKQCHSPGTAPQVYNNHYFVKAAAGLRSHN